MKKFLKVSLLMFSFLLILTGCNEKTKEKEQKNNTETDNSVLDIKDTKVNELDVVDFVVLYENNISDVYFEVQNNTDDSVSYSTIECILYDKNGNVLYSFDEELGILESLDEIQIAHKVDIDLTKAVTVEYTLN